MNRRNFINSITGASATLPLWHWPTLARTLPTAVPERKLAVPTPDETAGAGKLAGAGHGDSHWPQANPTGHPGCRGGCAAHFHRERGASGDPALGGVQYGGRATFYLGRTSADLGG